MPGWGGVRTECKVGFHISQVCREREEDKFFLSLSCKSFAFGKLAAVRTCLTPEWQTRDNEMGLKMTRDHTSSGRNGPCKFASIPIERKYHERRPEDRSRWRKWTELIRAWYDFEGTRRFWPPGHSRGLTCAKIDRTYNILRRTEIRDLWNWRGLPSFRWRVIGVMLVRGSTDTEILLLIIR